MHVTEGGGLIRSARMVHLQRTLSAAGAASEDLSTPQFSCRKRLRLILAAIQKPDRTRLVRPVFCASCSKSVGVRVLVNCKVSLHGPKLVVLEGGVQALSSVR